MELLQLKYFCTVAKYENITRAAKEHLVPQPAMSKTISRLEHELGIKLFERTGNRLRMTEKGKEFYMRIDRALLGISDAVLSICNDKDVDSNNIRLLLNTNRDIVLKFISHFTHEHPQANFYIDHNNSADDLSSGKKIFHSNLCISALPVSPEFDKSVPLLRERLLIAVYKTHPLAQLQEISLHDLKNERFVLLSTRFRMHTCFINYCQSNGLEPNICMYCADPSYVRHAVDNGLGISIMPELSWKQLIGSNTVLIPIAGEDLFQTHRILWDSSRYMPPLVKQFRDELIEHYRQTFGDTC